MQFIEALSLGKCRTTMQFSILCPIVFDFSIAEKKEHIYCLSQRTAVGFFLKRGDHINILPNTNKTSITAPFIEVQI